MNTTTIVEEDKTRAPECFALCVLYIGGMFGYRRVECRSVSIVRKPWAQFDRALVVEYVEKGKRKAHGFVCYSFRRRTEGEAPGIGTNTPFVVVDSTVDEPATFEDIPSGTRTRHLSCDPAWDREFDDVLTKSTARVLFDGRNGGRID